MRRSATRSSSSAFSRPTPTPTTSRVTAGSRSSTACRCTSTTRPALRFRTSRSPTERRSTSARSSIRTIHTPGHRPEHCAFAVIDRSRGDEPWLVLTGDSLFVGDAARPDLAVEAVRGRRRPLPLAASPRRARRRRRGVPGPRRRLAVRSGDELQAVDDDRLRAPLQPCARRELPGLHRRARPGRSRRGRRTWRRSSS